jgi:hypothetical protein
MLTNDLPLVWDRVVTGSTAKYSWTKPISSYEVSSSGDYAIAQTKQRFIYEAGQGHKIIQTFIFGAPVNNTVARVGYFNTDAVAPYTNSIDGLYLERENGNINICIANNGDVTKISQSLWSEDTMDGRGPSEINLDFTKSQIFVMDFQWLGVGRARFGFVVGGVLRYCHTNKHANVEPGVYMSSPNHSGRYEIRSTGGTSVLRQVCMAVQSEGTNLSEGLVSSVSSDFGGTAITDTNEALVGVRLHSGSFDQALIYEAVSVMSTTVNANYRWSLHFNPTLSQTVTWNKSVSHAYDVATGSGATLISSPGVVLDSGWVSSAGRQGSSGKPSTLYAGATIAGRADEYWLAVYALAAGTFYGSMNVRVV